MPPAPVEADSKGCFFSTPSNQSVYMVTHLQIHFYFLCVRTKATCAYVCLKMTIYGLEIKISARVSCVLCVASDTSFKCYHQM